MLRCRHGADLVEVPARVGGDKGLDSFTTGGLAYQCYAPEEPLSADQRYEKLRDKMTADVGKFIDNATEVAQILGPVVITHWILLVPQSDDRRTVAHAMSSQTPRLRSAALGYCASDVVVVTHTHQDYAAAYFEVVEQRLAELVLPVPQPPDFSLVRTNDIDTMREKLDKLPDVDVPALIQSLLGHYLQGRDDRSFVADHYAELDADLTERLTTLERRLEVEFRLSTQTPNHLLAEVIRETGTKVHEALPQLRESDRLSLTYAQVADWLMRCPLDFVVASVDAP